MKEKLAAISVLVIIVAVPGIVGWYQYVHIPGKYPSEVKVFDITGVAENGAWTLEKVSGLNYWWKRFTPMTLYLEVGDQVLLNLRSADLFHRFYVPGLNLGPVDIKPGCVEQVRFRAEKAGIYQYYCTSLCGGCHFYMTGWIVITPEGETPVHPEPIVCPLCFPDFEKPSHDEMVLLGEYFYLKLGCVTCHSIEGRGGVENYNYINKTVPAHNTTAEKMFLSEREDAEAFNALLMKHENLDALEEEPDIPRFKFVVSRLKTAKEIVKKGKYCAKLDMDGPDPPLQMPTWQAMLTDRDIDAVFAYFITLYPWEDDEEESFWEDETEGL
jgi:mono/diheme cytochrome c family protein